MSGVQLDLFTEQENEVKKVFILRGLPGCGKSTFARILRSLFVETGTLAQIVSADHYFTDYAGEYRFDASRLRQAHQFCRDEFDAAFDSEKVKVILVDNTNLAPSEYAYYCRGDWQLITVGSVNPSVVPQYASRGLHDVPLETYAKMVSRYKA